MLPEIRIVNTEYLRAIRYSIVYWAFEENEHGNIIFI